jgi:hypothetical protein
VSARRACAAASLALACAGGYGTPSGPIASTRPPEEAKACYEADETRGYLEDARNKTIEVWKLPDGVKADHKVSLQFLLGKREELLDLRVLEATSHALGRSAVTAMRTASPFGPPPGAAVCLLDGPITATFRNPETVGDPSRRPIEQTR